uniref:Uncharacterized protein n=1 Tax=Rhizophora mucronata TaxID=61149 RepID=A0A2P2QV84_RHIMU
MSCLGIYNRFCILGQIDRIAPCSLLGVYEIYHSKSILD